MADDFGHECVTKNVGESYQTPNLNKLSASGVRFENCTRSRFARPKRRAEMKNKEKAECSWLADELVQSLDHLLNFGRMT